MQLPQMTTRRWMGVVAVAAIVSWGIRWDGFRALVWEVPLLGAALALWLVSKKRLLDAAVVASAVILWLVMWLIPFRTVALGVGHADVRVSFVVLDAGTGQPVEAASIHLRDPDYAYCPGVGPFNIDLDTQAEGSASVLLGLQFVNSWEPATGRLLSFCLRYPNWDINVQREAYQRFAGEFWKYERGNPRFHDGNATPPHNPPPVVIRLRKQGRASR